VEVIIAILAIVGGFAAFDALALHFGIDSREGVGDDHARSTVEGRP
jgi:hypothetical protein